VFIIADSSITKNFVISGKERVGMFVNAIKESAKNRPVRTPVAVKFIKGEEELRELMRFTEMKEKEKTNADK
jgi:pyruvate-formate lyase-activating enzyme